MKCNRCSDEGCSQCANRLEPLSLSCPTCAEALKPGDQDDALSCGTHTFGLPELLLAQADRAANLLEAGCKILEEQEQLVRNLARYLTDTDPEAANKLEDQADRLNGTIGKLRDTMSNG